MGSPRGAAVHVGRIGALAVALGIGAWALVNGTGVASAEATDAADTSATQSATQSPAQSVKRSAAPGAAARGAAGARSTSGDSRRTPAGSPRAAASRAKAPGPFRANSVATTAAVTPTRTGTGSGVAAPSAAPSAAAVAAAVAAAAVPATLGSAPVGWVTGQSNNGYPGIGWAQTNNTSWAGVYGTDVGTMWLNGVNDTVQIAFGDTFSGPNMTGNWRSNILLLSRDLQLYDGLSLINTGYANQFIPAARNQVFFIGSETTNIPTSAVYANANNYVNYMSVKSWDSPGRWTTNYSAISMYNPTTDKWDLQTSSVRSAGWFRSSAPYRAGDQNFQQMAYVLQPESQVASTGGIRYVYALGTPAGRAGSAFLSRVPENAITDLSQYDYWDGTTWVKDRPAVAAPIIGDSPNSAGLFGFVVDLANNPNFFGGWFAGLFGAKSGGNVSEMSIQYNDYLGKYVILYGNGLNNVILRTADTPEGAWSDPVTIATSVQYPGLYAPMIHPLSGTGQLTDASGQPDASTLYWNMSLWGNYNVVLMKTDLSALKTALV